MSPDNKQENNDHKLHVVFGGDLVSLGDAKFKDLKKLDVIGFFPDYSSAYDAWKDAAQRSVDDAHMRYFVVCIQELIDPAT